MAGASFQTQRVDWVESLPALIIGMVGFFSVLVWGVLNLFTVPRHAESISAYLGSCRRAGLNPGLGLRLVVAMSDLVRHHTVLSLLAAGVLFTGLVLLARRLGWKLGMVLAVTTIFVFLVVYPVIVVCSLFPPPMVTV